MKTLFSGFMLLCGIAFSSLIFTNAALAQAYPHLQVSGRFLKSPCGDTIILRGVNYSPYNWGYTLSDERMSQIAQTGANAVRIQWYATPDPNTTEYTPTNLDTVLARCVRYKMIPIVDLHDQTCANTPSAVITMSNYFLQPTILTILMKYKNYLVLNLANEALYVNWDQNPVTALQTYTTTYNTIVQNYRNANLLMPLMIDAPDCGTNIDVFNTAAATLTAGDAQHNILYSAHTYWYSFANNDPVIAQQKLQTTVTNNIPIVIGELANYQDDAAPCAYLLPYQQLMTNCKALKISWLAYGWHNDQCASRQLTTNGLYASLTPYGNVIVNDALTGLHATAVRSPYLLNNGVCPVTCTPPTPTIVVSGATCPKTLTASGGGTYLWSTGATTLSISATAAGVFTVTVTNANNCTATATAYVDCCNLNISELRYTVYAGSQLANFVAPSVTGCAAGSVLTYLWDFGDGTTSTLAAPGSHTYAAAGMKTVCLTVKCTKPDASYCTAKCCRDMNVGKTCSTLAYPTFSFTAPATGSSFTFTGTAVATGIVANSDWNVLDATNTSIATGTSNNFIYSFPNAGEYTVCRTLSTVADANFGNYCSNKLCRKITVVATTGCNALARFYGLMFKTTPLTVNFNSNSVGASTTGYAWEYSSTSATGPFTAFGTNVSNPIFTFPAAGIYWVRMTINKGMPCETTIAARLNLASMTCTSGSNLTPVARTINPDGSIEVANSDINEGIALYPNPTEGNVTITFGSDIKATTMIKVYDMKGQLVTSYRTQEGENQTSIDLSNQASGMYLFHIENENGEKLVKKVMKFDGN